MEDTRNIYINKWFKNEVWIWSASASVLWSAFAVPPALLLFTVLTRFNMLHPIVWITGSLYDVLTPSTWPYTAIILLVVAFTAFVSLKFYSVVPDIPSSRLAILGKLLQPKKLVFCVEMFIGGGVMLWALATLHGGRYTSLSVPCEGNSASYCLNEIHTFVVLFGCYLGLMYAVQFFYDSHNYTAFPIVQQTIVFQVKSKLAGLLVSSFKSVLRKIGYFYLAYFFIIGRLFKFLVTSNTSINVNSTAPVDSIRGMLDIPLFLTTLIMGSFLLFTLSFTRLMYGVYVTQPVEFPISSAFEQEKDTCLSKAMSCDSNKHIQYLAYQDLYLLSKHSPTRRREVYSLSQLGGHPRNWSELSTQCLTALNQFSYEITAYNRQASIAGPMGQMGAEKVVTGTATGSQHLTSPMTTVTSPVTKRTGEQDAADTSMVKEDPKKPKSLSFFTQDLPEAASRKLFAEAQKVMWAAEGISFLVTASISEDKFGVVQRSLADILVCLLSLQEAVEKHIKLVAPPVKKNGKYEDSDLRLVMKAALKTSLYRIVHAFGPHLQEVDVGPEYSRRLGMFMDYKE